MVIQKKARHVKLAGKADNCINILKMQKVSGDLPLLKWVKADILINL